MSNSIIMVDFLDKFREELKALLEAKTGWGRNEVLSVVDQAINKAVLKTMRYD